MRHLVTGIALGLALMLTTDIAQAVSLSFVPPAQDVVVGQAVSVELRISDLGDLAAPSLSTFDLDLSFDETILAFEEEDADGNGVADSVALDPTAQLDLLGLGLNPVSAGLVSPGTLNLFDLSLDSPDDLNTLQAGSFPLATITFTALAPGTSPLSLVVNALGDASGDPLTAEIGGGSVTVRTPTDVPEPGIGFLLSASAVGLWVWRRKGRATA